MYLFMCSIYGFILFIVFHLGILHLQNNFYSIVLLNLWSFMRSTEEHCLNYIWAL